VKKLFRPTEYYRPMTVEEAVSLLAKYGERARPIAGGTDLLVEKPEVECLVDITRLGLNYVKSEGDHLKIGAATTLSEVLDSKLLKREPYSVLWEEASRMGDPSIRNTATVGGNICSAVPSADFPPGLIALEAKAKILNPTGERTVTLEEFFLGPRKTVLQKGELLAEIQVPPQPARTAAVFLKKGRTRRDIALVNAAVRVTLGLNGACEDARIVLGAVAPTPLRAGKAEALVKGRKLEASLVEEAAETASEETRPISDVRASAEYRRELSRVFVKHALTQAADKALRGG
jgi:carbon-monoxide dehydrogenase medium subunit